MPTVMPPVLGRRSTRQAMAARLLSKSRTKGQGFRFQMATVSDWPVCAIASNRWAGHSPWQHDLVPAQGCGHPFKLPTLVRKMPDPISIARPLALPAQSWGCTAAIHASR